MNLQYWSFSENYIYGDNGVVALQIATETSNTNSMQISTYEIENACGWQSRQAMQTRQCGGISADLTFLLLFWSSKKVEEENMNGRLYDPVIARFLKKLFVFQVVKVYSRKGKGSSWSRQV